MFCQLRLVNRVDKNKGEMNGEVSRLISIEKKSLVIGHWSLVIDN